MVRGHTRDDRAKSDSETVNKQIEEKRRKNSALRDARVDPRWRDGATKTHLGQGTTQEIGKKVPKRTRDTEVKETNQSGFDPAGVKRLLNVDERDKSELVKFVHEAEGHGVGTPAETALGRVELWKNVGGGNASVNEVLKKFESAGRERNGAVGIKRSGVTISLDDRNDKARLPCGRNHREPQHKVEKRK